MESLHFILMIVTTLISSWLSQTSYFGQFSSIYARSKDENVLLHTFVLAFVARISNDYQCFIGWHGYQFGIGERVSQTIRS